MGVPSVSSDRMRHMFVGRIVSQHVMLFEPVAYAAHLESLARLVARSVVSPVAAQSLAVHSPANLATVLLAERAGLADGDWPAFIGDTTVYRLPPNDHQVVAAVGSKPSTVDALGAAVALLATAQLDVFAELGVGGLVPALPADAPADPRDGLLLASAEEVDPTDPVQGMLAAVLATIPRLWGAADPDVWRELAAILAPARVEDVFVAGCVREISDRIGSARLATLAEFARVTTGALTAGAHAEVMKLKRTSLLAELLLCWWPGEDRVVHLFTSELDYLTRLPAGTI